MARISLRAYNRDIEVMIDKNQIDEAFAHCRYILELYPKHIDTYRLMGKALLEAQRFSDASDVFHRVLSSVPDDFIAHLGMSIIREDESNLDAAIWHMERSFEVQPSNAAVQVELRRLYGLRDGVTPQKIQLTRGALARMSAKSHLHSQAIAELRSALSGDPQRPDLQVVLAEMYLQTGSRMEAIETCNALINKLPYCLTANRILAEVLPETERADQAHEYKTRVGELDPYYLQLSPVAPTLEQVPDGAVTIERFDYDGESYATVEQVQPDWATSLGVDIDEDQPPSDETTPEWLTGSDTEQEISPEADLQPEEKIAEVDEIEEDQLIFSDEDGAAEAEDIPDWMSEIGEPEKELEAVPDFEAEPPSGKEGKPEDSQVEAREMDFVSDAEQFPYWMQEASDPDEEDDSDSHPGFVAAAGAAAVGAVIAGQDDDEPEPDHISELEDELELSVEEPAEAAESLPDWMTEDEVGEEFSLTEEDQDREGGDKSPEVEPEAETPGWMEAESEETGPSEEWLAEAETTGETPDWLREAMEGAEEEQEPVQESAALAADAGLLSAEDTEEPVFAGDQIQEEDALLHAEPGSEDVEIDEPVVDEGEEEIVDDSVIGTLASAAAAGLVLDAAMDDEDDLAGDEELTSGDGQEVPAWLQDLGEDLPSADLDDDAGLVFEDDELEAEQPVLETALDDAADEAVPDEPAEPFPANESELTLETAGAEPGEDLEESEFPESIPDWLSEVSPEDIPEEIAEAEAELDIVRAEIPVWLRKMEAQHQAEMEAVDHIEELELDADFTDLSGEDVPSWLMSAMEPELAHDAEETAEVEDISDVFKAEEAVAIDEIGLDSDVDEDIDTERVDAEEEKSEDLEFEVPDEEISPPETIADAASDTDELYTEDIEAAIDEVPELTELTPEDQLATEQPISEAGAEITGEAAEDLEFEVLDEEISPLETVAAAESEADEMPSEDIEAAIDEAPELAELTPEDLDHEIAVPETAQEIAAETDEVPAGEIDAAAEGEQEEGFGIPDLAAAVAAGAAAYQIWDDEDTQPISVKADFEGEEEVEEPALVDEDDIAEGIPEAEADITPAEDVGEAEIPALAADVPMSGEDEDAALAWLESLAAKQGAAEEELLTPVDERRDAPPEWVVEEASEDDTADAEERDSALTAAAVAGLTAGILADDEETVGEEIEEEPDAEFAAEEPSEWIPEIIPGVEGVTDADSEPAPEDKEIEPVSAGIEEAPDLVEELAAATEIDLDQVEAEDAPEEIPGWLSGLAEEQEAAAETEIAEWTPGLLAEEPIEDPTPIEAAPAEKLDLNAASLAQLERIPGIGFIHAQNIVDHRAASGSFTDISQLTQVEGLTLDMVADLEEYLSVEVVTEDSTAAHEIPALDDAWESIDQGKTDLAVDQYADLINKDQHLDEVIRDLQAALSKYPSDPVLYQTLGDAYMHANMLQEALDAYNRAEDLLG